jgi:hypothetical protein
MGNVFDGLDEGLKAFIAAQHMFFVATAPLSAGGHLNVSPKGLDTFRVLGPKQVAYLDLTGSGVETVGHLRENGRITLMFCAFGGAPRILRLYGKGQAVEPGDEGWADLIGLFPDYPGVRSVVLVDLERIADSCGYGVPMFEFAGERKQLTAYAERKGPQGMEAYKRKKNRESIDGLPASGASKKVEGPMRIDVRRADELPSGERDALRMLSAAVYPPVVAASWPGRLIEWSSHQWCVLCRGDDG